MGWCQDFSVEIRPGCDHLMVAHRHSCFCEQCQTQCLGRFRGCDEVWERGPVPVDLRPLPTGGPWWRSTSPATEDPSQEPDGDAGPLFVGELSWPRSPARPPIDDGGIGLDAEDRATVRPEEAPPSAQGMRPGRGASTHLVDLLEALTDEIRALQDQVDRLEDRAESAEDLARTALAATRDTQVQLRRAIQEQHGAIANDLGRLRAQLARQRDHAAASFFGGDSDAVIAHVDARIEWLLGELTSRLVVLGNQVAISGRQLRDTRPGPGGQPSAGH